MCSLHPKWNSNGHYRIKKISLQFLLYLAFLVWMAHGGRLLRYKGCICGIENIPRKDIFHHTVHEYRRSKRIIGGKVVSINQFPWMVGLFASRFAEHPFCGASLISNKHLITAAHCIKGVVAKYASLADHDTSTKKETKSFLMRIRPYRQSQAIHDKYTEGGPKEFPLNDIAVLELVMPIRFSQSRYRYVRPICLPDPIHDLEDQWVTVAGWGRKQYFGKGTDWHENHRQSEKLRSADLRTFRHNECDLIYGDNGDVKRQHLCAYYEGKDACQGDSGGPLFAKRNKSNSPYEINQYEIVGITSFGRDCGLSGFPGIYTRLGDYVWWILQKLQTFSRGPTIICRGTLGRWINGG